MKNLFVFLLLLPLGGWAQSVTITSVSPATVCVGAPITITYTSDGNFNGAAKVVLNSALVSNLNTLTVLSGVPQSGTLTVYPTQPNYQYTNLEPYYSVELWLYTAPNNAVISNRSQFVIYQAPFPTVPDTYTYCLNDTPLPISSGVSGTGSITYYTSLSATGTAQPPAPPSTAATGYFAYFVTQTIGGCESLKARFDIIVSNCNVTEGFQTGQPVTSGVRGGLNTFLGPRVGVSNTTGSANVFIGSQTGYKNTEASSNTFIGDRAGYSNVLGGSNVFIGNLAGYNNINGQANMFLGPQAGSNSTTGNYNVFLGNATGNANTTGSDNTAIGASAGPQNTTGVRNTFLGEYSGFNSQTGNENVFIGFGTKAGTVNPTNLNNAVAIGANAIVSQSNSVILGSAVSSVGIGNSAPKNKLEITQGTANQSGLRLTNLTSASPASLTNQYKFLTVNDQGDVVLASLNGSARLGVSESLWERKGSFLQSVQGEAIIIGSKVSQTPAGYKLFVEDGILTEKVKVAVKNTAEWSDKVFEPTYTLRPLAEVAQYINTHQHLPGVPSAKEMVEQGNDLHKTDAKLLEKIEELTLYSIQLEKTNQNLKEDIKSQQKQQQQQQAEIDELKRLVKQLANKK